MRLIALATAVLLPLTTHAQAQGIDPAPLTQSDLLGREIGFGLASEVLDAQGRGQWSAGRYSLGRSDPDGAQSSSYATRNAVAGFGFGDTGLSAFLGYGQGASDLADDRQQARIRSYFLGLAYAGTAGRFDYGAAVYAGRSHNVTDAPDTLTGTSDHDGRLLGLSLRAATSLPNDINLSLQGDVLQHETRDFPLSGYGGTTVDARSSTATRLRAEVSRPTQMHGWTLSPFAALAANAGDQDDFVIGGTTVGAADILSGPQFSLGTGFTAPGGLNGRLEVSTDDDGNTGGTLGLSLRF
ncbi:hypothetical protein [Sagittula sp. S175]|uniref:hypothetical protein n=1 Tax=Sagittula sp. S175 TaxID=3415129 RepID=UPI003C7DAB7F